VYKTYEVHSKSKKSLNDFEQDGYEGTKLLFCVDMLNEGIHVSGVDAVVFLRATCSRNIWFQQMGRVMDAGKKKAVILDLVSNARGIEDIAFIRNLQKLYQQKVSLGGQVSYRGGTNIIEDFDIIDYTDEDIVKLLESLKNKTSEECLIELYNFIKKEERLPNSKKEVNLYKTLLSLRKSKYDKEYLELVKEIKDLCNKLGIDLYFKKSTSKECLINLYKFIKKEERLPINNKKERSLYTILQYLRDSKYDKEYLELVKEIKDLCNKLGIDLYFKKLKLTSKECLINLYEFIKKEERLPNQKKETNLSNTLQSLRKGKYDKEYLELVKEIKDLCNKLGIDLYFKKSTSKECLINLYEFIKKEERLPTARKGEEMRLYNTLRILREDGYKKYPKLVQKIKDLCDKLNLPLKSRRTE
jgi:thiamine monophosphate synthase